MTEVEIRTRKRPIVGVIASAKMQRTAICEIKYTHDLRKYQRQEKRVSRLKVHNPDNIAAVKGDKVIIRECRPISKTKKFVIVQKVKNAGD